MKFISVLLFFGTLGLALCYPYTPFIGKDELDDSFDWLLAQKILQKGRGNTLFSPISVKILLAILLEASDPNSQTYRQLQNTLFENKTLSEQRDYFEHIIGSLKEPSEHYDFRFGSKVYYDKVTPQPSLASIVEQHYHGSLESINFSNHPIALANMNGWCSQVTNGHIRKLISEEALTNPNLVAILINAIYFNGKWVNKFPEERSQKFPFYEKPDQSVNKTFMQNNGKYYYGLSEELDSKILRLPYKGNKYSMVIILPNTINGLGELIEKFNSDALKVVKSEISLNLEEMELIRIPKFKFEYLATEIIPTLKEIGIHDIFHQNTASFPLLNGDGHHKFFVNNVVQKAAIEVDEKGSTVVVATYMMFSYSARPAPPKIRYQFIADHPFLFFIKDDTTGMMIFCGKVTNPT